jgi:hypothetical protein
MHHDQKRRGTRLGGGLLLVAAMVLQACGGGGGAAGESVFGYTGSGSSGGSGGSGSNNQSGNTALLASSSYAQQCAPGNTEAAASLRSASLTREKQWLRAYFDEAYLWREEVPAVNADAAAYSGSHVGTALAAYFDALVSPAVTASGAPRDRFSFMTSTREWNQLSAAGVSLGYGLEWSRRSATPPRELRLAYVEPGSPAAQAGLQRGDVLVTVDGTSADAGDAAGVAVLNAALYPSRAGEVHNFVFSRPSSGALLSPSLAAAEVSLNPVPLSRVISAADGAKVGYLLFNDHIATSEALLINAVQSLRDQGVSELVLDLRYNGGGYLFIASELAYMIAGPGPTSGQVFEQLRFNSRRQAETSSANARTPFYDTSCVLVNGNCSQSRSLPTLGLSRVYVLAQNGTCSASEAVINGLRGVNVEVRLIGGTTCGKPYGFTAKDNCGYSYFPIEFVGTNAKGFGDYADGFVPGGNGLTGVPGCRVADDLSRALGDSSEGMLAAALQHRLSGQCPAQPQGASRARALSAQDGLPLSEGAAARRNRIAGGRP